MDHGGGSVAEWFGVLNLKSGDPWFKSSILPLPGFVLSSPEFNSMPTGQPPSVKGFLIVYVLLAQRC